MMCPLLQKRSDGSENGDAQSKITALKVELEETKQSLQKAREENNELANRLESLRLELEQTKRELNILKKRESRKDPFNHAIEDLKFVENSKDLEIKTQAGRIEFEKKRIVRFASPPSLAQVIASDDGGRALEKPNSLRKKGKKKPLELLIGAIFSKKRENEEEALRWKHW